MGEGAVLRPGILAWCVLFASVLTADGLDHWIDAEIERLRAQNDAAHEENAEERLEAFAETEHEVFVLVVSADEQTHPWQLNELKKRINDDIKAVEKRRVAAGAKLQKLIDVVVEQSSDFFDADDGVPFGEFTRAQVFVHTTITHSYSPVLTTPDEVRPRGRFRYLITDYTVAAYDIATAEILLESSFQTLLLEGPGD